MLQKYTNEVTKSLAKVNINVALSAEINVGKILENTKDRTRYKFCIHFEISPIIYI